MTDRDTFAAAALTGLIANGDYSVESAPLLAYQMADAMLRLRNGAVDIRETVQFTLTDHERACVEWAADNLDACGHGSETLRRLLDRLA